MSDDEKTVPQPDEAGRDDDAIHYYEVDETNVGDADRPPEPQTDEAQGPEAGEEPHSAG
jgi:hypothetical protein